MKKLTQKTKEVLDICLSSESPEVKAKVYEILEISELDASDPMFLVLALTGQMRVLIEAAPVELSKLLTAWKEQSASSLQSIEQAITLVRETQQQQADTIRETIEIVTTTCVEDIKQAGMATTSAIAEANSETLAQASRTATAAAELTNATVALRDEVSADRRTNEKVLQNILQQVLDAKTELNQAVDRTKGMYGAMDKLQNKIRLSTALGSIAPLSALGFAAIGGAIVYGWGLHMYWGDAGNYLTVVKENRTALNYCFKESGERKPGFTCKVVPQKKK